MNTKVLKYLEDYANNPTKLRAALGEYMKSLGITPLEHTLAVLEYLFHNQSHPSAEDIFRDLQPAVQSLTRTAVNSTLEVLAQLGAIQIVRMDTYDTRYEGDTSPHAHLICASCGAIENIPFSQNVSNMIAIPKGSVIDDIQIMCLGICAKCNRNLKKVN